MPLQPKLACNSDTRTLCSTPKRCNSNDAVSTFEIHVGELHATFLRNHNMRRHKDPSRRQPKPSRRKTPKQKTPQARKTTQAEDNSSTEDPRNPDSRHNRHKHGGTAPVMWRCTRTEEVHCLRIGCSAPTYKNKRGTGPPNHSPPHPSMRSWALLVAGWARRPRHHLHPGPLRHLPHPYMRRAHLGCSLHNLARNSIETASTFEIRTLKFSAFGVSQICGGGELRARLLGKCVRVRA